MHAEHLTSAQLYSLRKAARLTMREASKLYAVPVKTWKGFETGTLPVPREAIALLEREAGGVRPIFDLDAFLN